MSTPLRELTGRMFAAVEAKDLNASLQCIADDAVFIDPHYPSQVMIGKAAITDGLRWAYKGTKQFGFEIVNYLESPDGQRAAIEMATHHVLQSGMHLRFSQAFFVDAQDGLITRLQAYEPYSPPGVVGVFLGVTRLQRRLRGQPAPGIGDTPGTAKRKQRNVRNVR